MVNEYILLLLIFVVFLYGVVHFLEFSSFLSRIAGIVTGSKVTSYALQQTSFVMTRFFFIIMMPIIGLIVDTKISNKEYLLMVQSSLICATIFYILVLCIKNKIVLYFCNVIRLFEEKGSLLRAVLNIKKSDAAYDVGISLTNVFAYIKGTEEGRRLFIGSAIVFCCYSIGVFLSFFAALNIYEYRSSIGQLSGLVNALATVLLTFYIEPKISMSIDKNDAHAKEKVMALLVGRFFGVSVLSQLVISAMWII